MRFLLGIALLILSIFLGLKFAEKYTLKSKFYANFYQFNKLLKSEISFGQTTIMNIANSLKNNSDFVVCLNEYLENKKFNFDKKYLSLEEKDFFKIYLSNIGIHDKATQMDYIAGVDGRIEEYYSNAKNDEKKYKTLYIKLGLLFGLMLFIILI